MTDETDLRGEMFERIADDIKAEFGEFWPTQEQDPDLRAFGPGLMHFQRLTEARSRGLGAGGVTCPKCGMDAGYHCYGGKISAYPSRAGDGEGFGR